MLGGRWSKQEVVQVHVRQVYDHDIIHLGQFYVRSYLFCADGYSVMIFTFGSRRDETGCFARPMQFEKLDLRGVTESKEGRAAGRDAEEVTAL